MFQKPGSKLETGLEQNSVAVPLRIRQMPPTVFPKLSQTLAAPTNRSPFSRSAALPVAAPHMTSRATTTMNPRLPVTGRGELPSRGGGGTLAEPGDVDEQIAVFAVGGAAGSRSAHDE